MNPAGSNPRAMAWPLSRGKTNLRESSSLGAAWKNSCRKFIQAAFLPAQRETEGTGVAGQHGRISGPCKRLVFHLMFPLLFFSSPQKQQLIEQGTLAPASPLPGTHVTQFSQPGHHKNSSSSLATPGVFPRLWNSALLSTRLSAGAPGSGQCCVRGD